MMLGKTLPAHLQEKLALCVAHPHDVLFLDIETTGLSHYYDEITIIGWSIGGQASTFVKGDAPDAFFADVARAKVMVTFNGIRFDQRFLRQEFPDVKLPLHHIDLMYLCRRVGLTGGQKAIERELGIDMRTGLADVDGFAAVLLWHRYLRGELDALSKLIRYNRADIGAMGAIFDHVRTMFTLQPDLFQSQVSFLDWAAPTGWLDFPMIKAPNSELSLAPHFDDLFSGTQAQTATIIGIDLTGSEARGSGWCLLAGKRAVVDTLFTDEELFERTIATKPDLVSIDSPLSLPFGRLSVDDSDPGRDEYGIMRQCERELKRRGVNVYPCLLPSMQKLTARGILLADRFRREGIPVIESYPGAAQDIMRIPRKGAGVEWLKLGLHAFGVEGDYIGERVSHDELDAITSALVGSFHLAGLTEALGTADEAPLIIPDLKAQPTAYVVGVSGPIAAGKTTFAKMLEARGYAYTRFSLVIDDLLNKRGLALNRENRQSVGQEINATGRQRWLAEQTVERVKDSQAIVVDGLRFPEDYAFLSEHFGARFKHVYIDAEAETRKARFVIRDSSSAFDTAAAAEVESAVIKLKPLSHEILRNDSTIARLEGLADKLAANVKGAM